MYDNVTVTVTVTAFLYYAWRIGVENNMKDIDLKIEMVENRNDGEEKSIGRSLELRY